jgi:cytochrome b561
MQSEAVKPQTPGMAMPGAAVGPGYGLAHKAFHWTIFALIAAQYLVGSIMPHIGKDTRDETWVAWHISIGAAILFFIVLRFAWRLARPVPLLEMAGWQTRLATFTHGGLYLLIFVMTILGWAAASYRGWTVWLFGIVPLPALAAKGTPWAHTAGDIHDWLVYVLLAFIVLHVAGALYHYFVLRDRVLQRMLPGT